MGRIYTLLRVPGPLLPGMASSFEAFMGVWEAESRLALDPDALPLWRVPEGEVQEHWIYRPAYAFLKDLVAGEAAELTHAVLGKHPVDSTFIDVPWDPDNRWTTGPPKEVFLGPPHYLTPDEVAESRAALDAWDPIVIVETRPDIVAKYGGKGPGGYEQWPQYVATFERLRTFYRVAADAGQAVFVFLS